VPRAWFDGRKVAVAGGAFQAERQVPTGLHPVIDWYHCFVVCLRPAFSLTSNYSATIGFALLTIRRFILCIVLGCASVWGVNAEAAPNGPAVEPAVEVVAPSDTTAELSWAGRLIRLYSTLAEIKARPTHDNVPGLVSKAFADAQALARTPGML